MTNNPFPGLRPFEANEMHLFFGRDGQSNELLRRLQHSRFLAVVGTSGSGKSSLVRAGLLPALHGGLMVGVESDWRIATMRPGNDPIGNMAKALTASDVLGTRRGVGAEVETAITETMLRRGSRGLIELVKQAKMKLREDGQPVLEENENLLIVVDQFEEIFRIIEQYDGLIRVKQLGEGEAKQPGGEESIAAPEDEVSAEPAGRHPKEEAAAFVKLLLEATKKKEDGKYEENIYVILTMRSDYLGDSAQFWGMPEAINDGQYLIPRMERDQRRQAIVGPVAVARGKISEPLVNQLLNDAGENPDHLPTLQHALMRMWNLWEQSPVSNGGLNLKHYDKIGRMSGALSQHANEAYGTLPEAMRPLARKVFKCLTEKGLDNREVRRPMLLGDICEVVAANEEEVKQVIEVFREEGRSFLMPPPPAPLEADTLIDISHESLIRGWDKLTLWVDEEAESARTYKRLADTALLKELGKEEYYRGAALQLALDWRRDNTPNKAWAQRYHPEYEKAIAFLEASVENSRKEKQDEEDRLKKELQRARELADVQADAAKRRKRYLVGLVFLTAVTFVTSGLALTLQRQALSRESAQLANETKLKQEAQDAEKVARDERANAVAREQEAQRLRQEARDKADALAISLKNEEIAKKDAIKAQKAAESDRDTARRLRGEKEEQATIYGHFKTAFDSLAEGNRDNAASSLQKALEYYTGKKDRSNIISTHINIGDVYRGSDSLGDPEKAIESYDNAIKLIKSGNVDDKLLVSALSKAARVWVDASEEDKEFRPELKEVSAKYFEEAAAVYNKLGQKDNESAMWFGFGQIFSSTDDERARQAFQKATDVYSMPFDGGNIAKTNISIGEHYEELLRKESAKDDEDETTTEQGQDAAAANRPSKKDARQDKLRQTAAEYYLAASGAYRESDDNEQAGDLATKAGTVLSSSKSRLKDKAAEAFETASQRYGDAGKKEEQTSALVAAGDVYREAENKEVWPLADKYYERALQVYRAEGNKNAEAETLTAIGRSYGSSKDPEQKRQGINYFKRAAEIYRDTQSKSLVVSTLLAAASVLEDMKAEAPIREAAEFREQALAVYANDVPHQVSTLIRIGRSFSLPGEDGQLAKTDEFFRRAVELAEKNGGRQAAAAAHLEIGVAYTTMRRSQLARSSFERALVIYQEINDKFGQAMTLYRLAGSYPPSRPEAKELTDRSLALFPQVLPGIEASGDKKNLADSFYALGWLYRQKKEYEQSLANFNKALKLYQSLPDQGSRVRITQNLIRTLMRWIDQKE